jgi:cation diffusion facilitator family transporter
VTLGLNALVSLAKVWVGTWTGSLAMVADGYHSLVDGSNNVLGLVVAALAYRPPDAGHPYGHRKFETAATLAIGAALLALAWKVLFDALAGSAPPPTVGWLNWAVMAGTIAMNLGVSWYEGREGRRLSSAYLIADAAHTRSDVYVSLGVVASFLASRAGLGWADQGVAMVIAAIIAGQALRILLQAFHELTDRAVIAADVVADVVRAVPGVLACAQVRTRGGHAAAYVDLVVKVDGTLTLHAAHEVADRVEAAVGRAFPHVVDTVVHLEPGDPR